MKKNYLLLLSLCLPLIMMAQHSTATKVMMAGKTSVFDYRIAGKALVDPAVGQRQSDEALQQQWNQQREAIASMRQDSRFLSPEQVLERAQGYRSRHVIERLDSIVNREGDSDPNGAPVSKQVFEYNEIGRPLSGINYVPNAETGEWLYYGEFGYEWNEQGYCISHWEINGKDGSYKYEYFYDNGGPLYNQVVYYNYENEEWIPSQMAQYGFDEQGRTIEETYSYYDADLEDWVQAQRHTATYDSHGWTTSYFEYVWDANVGDWAGSGSGFRWEYTADGQDAKRVELVWADTDWMAINQLIYTYNEANQLVQTEWQYWNAEHQDWRGGYVGQNGYVYNNSKTLYYYNEDGRKVLQETYNRTATTDYSNYSTYTTWEYSDLESGELETIENEYANIGQGLELYRRYTLRHKPVATAPTYDLSERKLTAGTDIMIKTQEYIRDIDDNGVYHGLEAYTFVPNEENFRYGSSKELVTYDAEGRQTGNHHWRGRRTGMTTWQWDDYDDWVVYNVDGYDGNVVAGYDLFNYSGEIKYPYYGFMTTHDFTMRPENVYKYVSSSNNEEYRKYKFLQTYNWENHGTVAQEDIYEYTTMYYYAEVGKAQGGWNEDGTPIVLANGTAEKLQAQMASNGEIYVGWTGNISGDYSGTVQLVDVEGYNVLGENGMNVNTTSTSGQNSWMGMAVDADDNLVVSFPDARDGSSKWETKPYAYKLNNNMGEQMWGAAGAAIPTATQNNVTMNVVMGADNTSYVTFYNNYDYSAHTMYVNRINTDGTMAWDESKQLPGAYATFLPSQANMIAVYVQDKKVYSQVYNADFEMVGDPAVISGDVEIKALPYYNSPFVCKSDENGGMFVVFADNSYNAKYYVQHITSDGISSVAQPVMLNAGVNIEGIVCCVDAPAQQLAVFYQAGGYNARSLKMQVINSDGTAALPETEFTSVGYGYTMSGAKVINDEYVVAYVNSINWSTVEQYVARISMTDHKVYGAKVGENATAACTAAVFDDDAAYYFWFSSTYDPETYVSTEQVQGVRYMLDNINDVIYEMSSAVDEIYAPQASGVAKAYDLMGREVDPDNAHGIIILNGKKIFKK